MPAIAARAACCPMSDKFRNPPRDGHDSAASAGAKHSSYRVNCLYLIRVGITEFSPSLRFLSSS